MKYDTAVTRYQDDISLVKESLQGGNDVIVKKYSSTLHGVYVNEVLITTTTYKRGAVMVKEIIDHLRQKS